MSGGKIDCCSSMLSQRRAWLPLLVLLALLPLHVSAAEHEARIDSAAAHARFEAVAPYLHEPDESAEGAVVRHCLTLDRGCLAFADTHAAVILAAVPDNPEFWAAYDLLLAADPLSVDRVAVDDLPAYQELIAGANGWMRRELVETRLAEAPRLHAQVMSHRRRLGLSNTLLEKMIFTATTSIVLPGINVYMARRPARVSGAGRYLLAEMLQPLTLEERSLRKAMEGERRYAAARLEEMADAESLVQLDDLQRVYAFVADRSEASWDDFWRHGLDILANVEVPPETYPYVSMWADYVANLRYLDASLIVLRALRDVYEGRVSPGPPAVPAPYGWTWRWEEESQTLCLDPGYLHASVLERGQPSGICHQYLTPTDSGPV